MLILLGCDEELQHDCKNTKLIYECNNNLGNKRWKLRSRFDI